MLTGAAGRADRLAELMCRHAPRRRVYTRLVLVQFNELLDEFAREAGAPTKLQLSAGVELGHALVSVAEVDLDAPPPPPTDAAAEEVVHPNATMAGLWTHINRAFRQREAAAAAEAGGAGGLISFRALYGDVGQGSAFSLRLEAFPVLRAGTTTTGAGV